MLKLMDIFRCPVRQSSLKQAPNELIRVKLGRVSGKPFNMKLWMFMKKLPDHGPLVAPAPIPEKNNMATHMFEQLSKKPHHLWGFDVFVAIKLGIKRNPLPFGSDADAGNSRDLGPAAGTAQNRCLPAWSPGSGKARDQQKTAFIEEDQMGTKFFGFFLYGAICTASSALFYLRPFHKHAFLVFGNSSPDIAGSATCDWDDSPPRISFRSLPPRAAWSIDRYRKGLRRNKCSN